MIKVRLYTQEEYIETHVIRGDGKRKEHHLYVADPEYHFLWDLLCPTLLDEEEAKAAPFRDEESRQLLKESYDIVFADDEDWYSVICEGTRMNIACLNKGIQAGLSMIHRSRQGYYTWCTHMCEKVWKALADLPMDIFVAMKIEDLGIYGFSTCLWSADYVILNYPYNDRSVEVKVTDNCLFRDAFYTKVPAGRQNTPEARLYRGEDGQYYTEHAEVNYAFQYYWKNDIGGILRYIGNKKEAQPCLEEISHTYDIFTLGKKLKQDENCIMHLEYLWQLQYAKPKANNEASDGAGDDEASAREYEAFLKELQASDAYKEYLYFRDIFRITSHLLHVPSATFRKLPMLIVDKHGDGTYQVHGDLTVKYPEFEELLYEAIDSRSADRERFLLVIDTEELLRTVRDIDQALCGFLVRADSVEIFDGEEAVRRFGAALKEACESGRCRVDDEFY